MMALKKEAAKKPPDLVKKRIVCELGGEEKSICKFIHLIKT